MVLNDTQLNALNQKLNLELRRGMLTLAVLGAVRTPSYGYSLKQRLAERQLEVDQGTLYPLLRRLEADGLLTSDWVVDGSRPRKYYHLSPDGEVVLRDLQGKWEQLVRVVGNILADPIENTEESTSQNGDAS